ncbi:porin [Hydrogenophaga sp.]|uniref:porin n=1 Tax=Hydrogenophaga sp. TaxID=1904254 RepID=UPI00271C9D72|nr:porin [Hydrogenophaga sp.]MDO9434879.1 porin [Hydrogenophaga sp.]
MKHPLLFLSALAAASIANAQSSVSLYGVLDASVSSYRATGAPSRTQMVAGGNQSSRLGFRGREDLGDGAYASFELEAGLFNDTGTTLATNTNNQPSGAVAGGFSFARKSFVALGSKRWGELRLGRDYTPGFWNLFAYDAFRTGVGLGGITTQGSTSTVFRASNSIGYFTPGCSAFVCQGFFGQVAYALGENPGGTANADDGRYVGGRVGYGGSNWDVALSHGVTKNLAADDYTQSSIGGSINFDVAKLMLLWGVHRTGLPVASLGGGTRAPFWQVSAWIPLGAGYIPVAFTRVTRNDALGSSASKFAVGYVHNLSKRTAVYTTYARIKNNGSLQLPVNSGADAGPTPIRGGSASGIDIGIRHVF